MSNSFAEALALVVMVTVMVVLIPLIVYLFMWAVGRGLYGGRMSAIKHEFKRSGRRLRWRRKLGKRSRDSDINREEKIQ
jgi:hypothetical protein